MKYKYPGFVDSHVHLENMLVRSFQCDLSGCSNESQLVSTLKQFMLLKNQDWVEGHDLSVEIRPECLDTVSQDISIVVRTHDEHMAYVNSTLANKMNLKNRLLSEYQMDQLDPYRPTYPGSLMKDKLASCFQQFLKTGIIEVHDVSLRPPMMKTLIELDQDDGLPLSVYGALLVDPESIPSRFHQYKGSRFRLSAWKIFIDGALGSHGAALSYPYVDNMESKGRLLWEKSSLEKIIQLAIEQKVQCLFHVLGDNGSRFLMDVIAEYFFPEDIRSLHFRCEHLEIVQKDVLAMMARYGMIASVQPWHIKSDELMIQKRVDPRLHQDLLPVKEMKRLGIKIIAGSDAPIEPFEPWKGIYVLESRCGISRKDALGFYTNKAAYSVEKNYSVLSDDLLSCSIEALLTIRNLKTVIDGKTVYEA